MAIVFRSAIGSLLASSAVALPQCPAWTPIFGGGGFDAEVRTLLEFDDGTSSVMYAGGVFRTAGDVAALRVARQDGAGWQQVGDGFDGAVNEFATFDFGAGEQLVATGSFSFSGAVPCDGVAVWSGTSWQQVAGGLQVTPRRGEALATFDDGSGFELHVGGDFGTAGVWRLRNGTWEPIGAFDDEVLCLEVFDDGTGAALYAGGCFTNRVARWDGTSWTSVGGLLNTVWDLEEFRPPSFPVGTPGNLFACTDGLGAGVFRLDGLTWSALPFSSSFTLRRARFQGPTQLWIGGASQLSSWDGSAITSSVATDGRVNAIAEVDENVGEKLWMAGRFESVSSVGAKHVAAKKNATWAAVPPPLVLAPTSVVHDIVEWDDDSAPRSKVVVCGEINTVSGQVAHDVVAFDGTEWTALGDFGANTPVTALAVYQDPTWPTSRIVAATEGMARSWDGSSWETMGHLHLGPAHVREFATFRPAGAAHDLLYAVGTDIYANGPSALVVWDGQEWVAPIPTDILQAFGFGLTVYDPPGALGPALYIAGSALNTTSSGVSVASLVRFDGVSYTTVPGTPYAQYGFTDVLAVDVGGAAELYALSEGRVHRYDGSTWTTTISGDSLTGTELAAFDDGSGFALYLGRHARLRNGTVETFASPFDDVVRSLQVLGPNSAFGECLMFGGAFSSIGTELSIALARWSDPCSKLQSYCTGKLNSAGCVPSIQWSGVASASSASFTISAVDVLNQKNGLFYFSIWGRNSFPFQGGTMCVKSPVARTPVRSSGGNIGASDCSGALSVEFAPWLAGSIQPQLQVGTQVNGQWWYRDSASASTTGLSNAIELEIAP